MPDFSVEGGPQNVWGGADFLRVERIFTIGQSPKIWGNFSKICIKINKKLKKYWENSRKNAGFWENIFNFLAGHKFLIMGKIKNLNGHAIMGGSGAEPPEGRKIFQEICRNR